MEFDMENVSVHNEKREKRNKELPNLESFRTI